MSQDANVDDLEEWEEWDPTKGSFFIHALAGSLAGAAEHSLIFPLDTLKTFAQSSNQNPRKMIKSVMKHPTCAKPTFLQRAAAFLPENGISGLSFRLWRGVSTMLIGCVPAHAVYFSVYEQGKALNTNHSATISGITGMTATIGHDLIMCPLDLIKQRLQLGFHSGIFDCVKSVIKSEGISAFYLAYPTTLVMNLPYAYVTVAVNDTMKDILNPTNEYNLPAFVAAGGIAGAVAAIITNPLDVVKTRIQTQSLLQNLTRTNEPSPNGNSGTGNMLPRETNLRGKGRFGIAGVAGVISRHNRRHKIGMVTQFAPFMVKSSTGTTTTANTCICEVSQATKLNGRKYTGMFDAAKKIYQEEGLRAFGRGAYARMGIHIPSVAISWATYETAKKMLTSAKTS